MRVKAEKKSKLFDIFLFDILLFDVFLQDLATSQNQFLQHESSFEPTTNRQTSLILYEPSFSRENSFIYCLLRISEISNEYEAIKRGLSTKQTRFIVKGDKKRV